jgi:hypothetical protein
MAVSITRNLNCKMNNLKKIIFKFPNKFILLIFLLFFYYFIAEEKQKTNLINKFTLFVLLNFPKLY